MYLNSPIVLMHFSTREGNTLTEFMSWGPLAVAAFEESLKELTYEQARALIDQMVSSLVDG